MTELRPNLPPLPTRMRNLRIDARGFPVPFFVAWINGVPDFRVIAPDAIRHCAKFGRCWICNQALGRFQTFIVGPMCGINRVSSEPPSHLECAEYAARACPFLTLPKMVRREDGLPEDRHTAGMPIARNPGVTLLWTSRKWKAFRAPNGVLFDIGEPHAVRWFAFGRDATREEVLASIDSGMPILEKAAAEEEGAMPHLLARRAECMALVPA